MPTRCHSVDVTPADSTCRAAGAQEWMGAAPRGVLPLLPARAQALLPPGCPWAPGSGSTRSWAGGDPAARGAHGGCPELGQCHVRAVGGGVRTPHALQYAACPTTTAGTACTLPALPGRCPHTACALPRAAHRHGPARARPARAALSTAHSLPVSAHGKGCCLPILHLVPCQGSAPRTPPAHCPPCLHTAWALLPILPAPCPRASH